MVVLHQIGVSLDAMSAILDHIVLSPYVLDKDIAYIDAYWKQVDAYKEKINTAVASKQAEALVEKWSKGMHYVREY